MLRQVNYVAAVGFYVVVGVWVFEHVPDWMNTDVMFASADWKSADPTRGRRRQRMLSSLLENHALVGMDHMGLGELLGDPNDASVIRGDAGGRTDVIELVYYLGPESFGGRVRLSVIVKGNVVSSYAVVD